MKKSPLRFICFFVSLLLFSLPGADHGLGSESPTARSRLLFNADWRFTKGDPDEAAGKLNYSTLKPWLIASATSTPRPEGNPGADVTYTQTAFDDSGWRRLNLPHDWGIEGPFKQEYPGETGKLPWWSVGWYRKHFAVPA